MKISKTNLYFSDNFKNWILKDEPKKIPIFREYEKHLLERRMTDEEIQKEWSIEPYSIPEFLGLITYLIKEQPKGEDGILLTNSYVNIFYMKLNDGRVVAVLVGWRSVCRGWRCGADGLGGPQWGGGNCVFSRSLKSQTLKPLDLESRVKDLEDKMSRIQKFLVI